MASRYLMQIVDTTTGQVVSYGPGSQVEKDFINDCADRITEALKGDFSIDLQGFVDSAVNAAAARNVGIFVSAQVTLQRFKDAMYEAIINGGLQQMANAKNVGIESEIKNAIEASIFELKSRVVP